MLESFTSNTFEYKKLSAEERASRGILGRLVGPIADSKHDTRNKRLYSKKLWENVFNDPIMQERIDNRCCFGELNHPVDRLETDPAKIAICLAEKPKFGADGRLYGVFDILDTPNGKILKTLCDYGTNIGVSSRGSGDILDNDEVDPDTYDCQGWDAVIIPSVKCARPTYVTESLDINKTKLTQALLESYENASEEDKSIMKETLDSLDIKLDEKQDVLDEAEFVEDEIEDDGVPVRLVLPELKKYLNDQKKPSLEALNEEAEEPNVEEPSLDDDESITVTSLIDKLQNYDDELIVEFNPISIEDKQYKVINMDLNESDPDKLLINIECEQDIANTSTETPELENEEAEETDSKSAEDDREFEKIVETLKESTNQVNTLTTELATLKNEKTVSDAKVGKLTEECEKYKDAFVRVGKIASQAIVHQNKVKELSEQLCSKEQEISELKSINSRTLKESLSQESEATKVLKENLNNANHSVEELQEKLKSQEVNYSKQLTESIKQASQYKEKLETVLNKYITFRASLLGVSAKEITTKLSEKFTIDDIENVCENILTENVSIAKIPFGVSKNSKIKVSEASLGRHSSNDVDASLLELAGLTEDELF